MSVLATVLRALRFYLEWKAEEAKFRTIYGNHDRYEIQKNRVKLIQKELHDGIDRGSTATELRVLENDLTTETEYLRTLQDHLDRWRDVSSKRGDTDSC